MPFKDLTFLLFAKDMSASRGFEKVAVAADASSTRISHSMAGASLAIAGLAIAVTAKSVKMAADFEASTTRLVTDAGESESKLGSVRDGILEISASVGTSAQEISKGMYYVESAGYHAAAGLQVMKAAAEGAKVGGADLKTVADALTTVMKDYAIAPSKATNATSELIATVSRGKTTMEDLAGSLHSVLPNAQALGIGLDQVLGAVASMTQEGISADQATQNLNHTIVSLANPTQVQTQAMAAMGLSSTRVAQQLGKRGLTGTLDELVTAITSHMGKSGLVLQSTFNTSQQAAQSADAMFKQLPASVQATARSYRDGTISSRAWTLAIRQMSGPNANLAKQWAETQNRAHGFSDALKSGAGPAKTFTAELSKMTGGQTGLQVALHLSGVHAHDFASNVKEIGRAAKGTQANVRDWDKTQGTFNQKMSQFSARMGSVGIQIGTNLLPALGHAADGMDLLLRADQAMSNPVKNLDLLFDVQGGKLTKLGGFFFTIGVQVENAAKPFIDLGNTVSRTVTGIEQTVGRLPGEMSVIGDQIVAGLVGGIQNGVGRVEAAAMSLAQAIPAPIRKFLGIASPSKLMRQYGEWTGKGLEQGLLGSVKQIQGASDSLAGAVISGFKSKDYSKGVETSALATIDHVTDRLQRLSTRRAAVETRLKAAQDSLSTLRNDRTSTITSTRTSTIDAGNVTSFAAPGDAIQGLQALVANTNRFKGDLQKLAKKGVDRTTFAQLVQGWQDDPQTALRTADDLLANPTDLSQIVALQKQLGTAASSLGSYAGSQEYDGRIASTGRQVTSLKGRDKVLTFEMQKVVENGLKKVAKETHVHLHLSGTYAGTKTDLAKTVTQAIKDAEKSGAISRSWNK